MAEQQRRIEGMDDESGEELCVCPTFNSYSSDRLADIAARVTDEYRRETRANFSDLPEEDESLGKDQDDFEFSLVRENPAESLYEGQIGRIFPIFNRNLLVNNGEDDRVGERQKNDQSSDEGRQSEIRIPLKNLILQEREGRDPPSTSSSEDDELETVPSATYCVWMPKLPEAPRRCKKSNSTGSGSKRWKLLDLLRRSNSDGKDRYISLTAKHKQEEKSEKAELPGVKKSSSEVAKVARKLKGKGTAPASPSPSAHESFYVRNRALKEGGKKKSFLPYRQDLVGLFANVNGVTRSFTPF